jgi:hypothetical protein
MEMRRRGVVESALPYNTVSIITNRAFDDHR